MDLAYELHAFTATLDIFAREHLRAQGVSLTQFTILSVVGQQAPTTGRTLATGLGLTPAAVSKNVTQLKARGLLVDLREPGMGNVQRLQLSPEGGEVLARLAAILKGPLDAVCTQADVDPQELARTIHRLNETALAKEWPAG